VRSMRPRQPLLVLDDEPVGERLRGRVLPDERMPEERPYHTVATAVQCGLHAELLVARDMRDKPRDEWRWRGHRMRENAVPPHIRTHLDDRLVVEERHDAVVPHVHDVIA